MKKLFLILGAVAFVLTAQNVKASDRGNVPEDCFDAPTLEDLTREANPRTGLNMDLVAKRQEICRAAGNGDDVSTQILLLQGTKTKMQELIGEELKIIGLTSEVQKNLQREAELPKKERHKSNMKFLSENQERLESRLSDVQEKKAILQDMITKSSQKIKEILGLKIEQIAAIPALPVHEKP